MNAPNPLTPREIDVLRAVRDIGNAAKAADSLGMGVATLKSHLRAIRRELDVRTTIQAVTTAMREGWL